MTTVPINGTLPDPAAPYDTQGAIVYTIGVIIWYAIGFGLILLDNIRPRADRVHNRRCPNVHQAVNDLHEQKIRNDILLELKDDEKRKKLWDIYYGAQKSPPLTVEKDKATVHSIVKQLSELSEQRRLLRRAVYGMSFDQGDDEGTENNNALE